MSSWSSATPLLARDPTPFACGLRWLRASSKWTLFVLPCCIACLLCIGATTVKATTVTALRSKLLEMGSRPIVVVTCADGPEGFAIANSMLREGGLFVRAAVANTSSTNARALENLGAELCLYDALAWHRQLEPLFHGADAAFILTSLDAQREALTPP